jgi:hypothetical protein
MEGGMIFRGRVVDNADPTDAFILKVTSDRLGGAASTAWPLLLRQSGQRLPPIGANVWLSESGGMLVWLGEWVAPGVESALSVAGDGGGESDAILTGYWRYSTLTTAPPTSGQIRTTAGPASVGDTVTVYIHHTDSDGYVWDAPAAVGDLVLLRDTVGNRWTGTLQTVDNTVPGPDGYSTHTVLVDSTAGVLAKNGQRVQVNLWHSVGGGGGSGSVDSVQPGVSITVDSADPANPVVGVIRSEFGYMHEQGVPSATWVVSHNLGYRPGGLVVMDSGGTINEPAEVIHDSINQTTIIFLYPFGGTAFLS